MASVLAQDIQCSMLLALQSKLANAFQDQMLGWEPNMMSALKLE
jgi:hypothetical protein